MFPKLIDFNYFTIHSYGFLLALGFLVGLLVAARAATKENIDKTVVYDLGIYLTIAALVGSKLLFLITDLNYYIDHPTEIFSLTTIWNCAGLNFEPELDSKHTVSSNLWSMPY